MANPIPTTRPFASVIIPNWNGAALLPSCLESLRAQSYPRLGILVVDGGSVDGSADLVERQFPEVRLLRLPRNLGFAGNVNVGLRAARGDTLLLLNNDARAHPQWVQSCVDTLDAEPTLGSVASLMLYEDGATINSAGDGLSLRGFAFQRGNQERFGYRWSASTLVFGASGGAAAYRRRMLEDVGLLDEAYFAYLEDVDLAFRAQLRGWPCRYQPAARVIHRGSATGGGPLASYYNARNLPRLWVKNLPRALLRDALPGIWRTQAERLHSALVAWRGAEARATLGGQLAGLLGLPGALAARRDVQRGRRVPDSYVRALLQADAGPDR